MATRFAIRGNWGSVSAAQDCVAIAAPTLGTLKLIELHITQDADETSEMLPFTVNFAATGSGTGTGATPVNLDVGRNALISAGAIAGFSAIYNLTGAVSTKTVLTRESVNLLSGFHFVPVPEARPIIHNGFQLVGRLETAPTATLSLSTYAVVEIE